MADARMGQWQKVIKVPDALYSYKPDINAIEEVYTAKILQAYARSRLNGTDEALLKTVRECIDAIPEVKLPAGVYKNKLTLIEMLRRSGRLNEAIALAEN